jgi:hypothetical protein
MSLLDTASLVVTPNGTKAGKLYSVVPSSGAGDLSVTRATTATRVNSSGLIESVASNVPRLDYSNGTCPSILVEPQRTNIATYSEDFNSVGFVIDSTINTNTTNSPSGVQNADSLIENTANGNHLYYIDYNVTNGTTYTYSFFCKSIGGRNVELRSTNAFTEEKAIIDLSNGSILGGSTSQIAVVDFGNSWYRISITKQASTSIGRLIIFILDGTNLSYTGNGTSGLYIWGAQLEAGSYATSYIPTTSASVTRNADVISKTGISSLIGQTEGTMFYDGYFGNNNAEVYLFLQKSGSTIVDDSMYIQKESGNEIRFNSFLSSTNQVAISGGSFSIGDRIKIAVSYKLNDFVMYINGVQIGTNTSGTPPTCANLHLSTYAGLPTNEDFIANKGVNLTAFWKTRLTNTQLAQLTTI